jgi:ribosomal protein S18 acetylase RimI-like enzyme
LQVRQVKEKTVLEEFLKRQKALNAYPLGDLDEPFWSQTEYFAIFDGDEIREIALLYHGMSPPILLAIQNNAGDWMQTLLKELLPQLPKTVYAHLSAGLLDIFEGRYQAEDHGMHLIMELDAKEAVRSAEVDSVEILNVEDFEALESLYQAAYPGHWFYRYMLENGPYVGIRDEAGQMISAGGTHVYSPQYGVAALGNIVTHPDVRGKGLGKLVSAKLCQLLLDNVDTIGLNVHTDNKAAVTLYQALQFKAIAEYSEITLSAK